MNNKRSVSAQNTYGPQAIGNSFNQYAGALKVMGPILGVPVKQADASVTPLKLEMGSLVALYNNSGSTAFATMAKDTAPAVPDATNGIALKPNDYTIISMGTNNQLRTSAGTVLIYKLIDDLIYSDDTGSDSNSDFNT